jgi:hypothetical protein
MPYVCLRLHAVGMALLFLNYLTGFPLKIQDKR